MSQPQVEFVVYIGNIPGHHHWTEVKDQLRLVTSNPGRNLGYVHCLSYAAVATVESGGFMAALVRVSKKVVAQQIYDALNRNGFNHHPVRLALFECKGNGNPEMVEVNFSLMLPISQQTTESPLGAFGLYTEWQYALQSISRQFSPPSEGAGMHSSSGTMSSVVYPRQGSSQSSAAPAQQDRFFTLGNPAVGAVFTEPATASVVGMPPEHPEKRRSAVDGSASSLRNEPVIVNGSVSDETANPMK